MLRSILIGFAVLLLLLISTAGLLVGILWYRPDWVINKSTLRWAQEKFLSEYDVPWDQLDLKLRRIGRGEYSVFLSGHDFCQDLGVYGKACLEELITDLEIEVGLRGLKALHIKNLVLKDQMIALVIPPSKEEPDPADEKDEGLNLKGPIETARNYLKKIKIDRHEIILDNTSLELQGESPRTFQIQLASREDLTFQVSQEDPSGLKLSGDITKTDQALSLRSHLLIALGDLELSARLPLLADDPEVTGNLHFTPKTDQIKSLIKEGQTHFSISLAAERASLALRPLDIIFSREPLESLKVKQCRTSLHLSMTEDVHLDCDGIAFNFDLTRMDFKGLKPDVKDFPKQLVFNLKSTLPIDWVNGSPQASNEALFASLQMNPVHHFLFQLNFSTQAGIQLAPDGWSLKDPSLNLDLFIPKFQNLVSRLKGSQFAVPAPFHVLKGHLRAKVNEIPETSNDVLKVPFTFASDLTGERNAVVGQAQGQFTYSFGKSSRRPALDLSIEVDQFHLQLPPFDPVRGIPSLTPDARISKTLKAPQESQEPPLDLNIQVHTSQDDSIRIYHPYLEPFASFGLRANVEEDTGFRVSKGSSDFKINYLKRTVTVQNMRLTKKMGQEDIQVDGQLMYEAAGYNVFIRFSGPMESPEVVLSSEPPLDRRDIISVLLYNRVDDSIASFEQESVGGTEAALADRAIGLFGIWAFASTPIEAVSYNSVTGTYSAQIKLPEGFRFSVGTDWESVQNLELRRRVRGNWIVSTIYHPDSDESQGSSEIMLQRKTSY